MKTIQEEKILIKKIPIYLEKILVQVLARQYEKKFALYSFSNQYKYRKFLQKSVSQIDISKGGVLDIGDLTTELSASGEYSLVKRVWSPGEYSLLGDIINIWQYGMQLILRVSLFDRSVEKIQFVDPQTGLCKTELDTYRLDISSQNNLIESQVVSELIQPIERSSSCSNTREYSLIQSILPILFSLNSTRSPDPFNVQNYRPTTNSVLNSFLNRKHDSDYTLINILSNDGESANYDLDLGVLPLINDGNRVGDKEYIKFLLSTYQRLDYQIYIISDFIKSDSQFNTYFNSNLYSDQNRADNLEQIMLNSSPIASDNNVQIGAKNFSSDTSANADSSNVKTNRNDNEKHKKLQFVSAIKLCEYLNLASIPRGWVNTLTNSIFITDYELYGSTSLADNETKKLIDDKFSLITKGDYLVHEDHGIGIYSGIETKNNIDYYVLTYAQGDKLYVPLAQTNKLTKYIGSGRKKPTLTRLSGGHWKGTKEKVYKDVEHIAKELLQLYAMRTLVKAPSMLNKEEQSQLVQLFIKSFEYSDTDDQRIATAELLEDLKKENPTDRLLVGDVGFGKTEIAIRGAYAAFISGMQTAFMAPTTVLVEQHKGVLIARFERFRKYLLDIGYSEENAERLVPKVESISRFATIAERREIVSNVSEGKVDILVGTHAILSNAVKFRKLGFVIIDEEQRFGVKHKEKLKAKRLESHVLSMTATPIPRTLNLALNSVRDLSVIATAPLNRKEIINITTEYSIDAVIQAITNELDRNGQIFYLHNRISDIEKIALNIMKYYPEAKVGVAHGRLSAKELAMTMRDFASMKLNVLVCTTIIENGIDLPNVNTMIIDDIERLGLAQMYQIRGRIGRGEKQAYAYFLHKTLGGESALRLEAIQDFHALGSGLLLANRDLEIRGAGTILGDNQSGAVDAVGFKLYSKMLEEAVSRLKKSTIVKEGIWIR
ncbi:MAG TPA: CarD family transcriptional regulator [Candidatus Dojkabacteria bacterium]|nr:CarD family transcriptional regulator [Candidatus Dojkabacteria bacterium]